ncbi:two-component regulator propeller domain-containing protein [Paraflavitalea speifideaquila]|uniref:two-component regulator propeller domain-containing protein n=1 Tax=Paraflavitalea speifideaquila TaxID=3076558 RepID=UPI003312FD8D
MEKIEHKSITERRLLVLFRGLLSENKWKKIVEKKIDADILDVFEDKNGQIWVSTVLAGFFILDKDLNIKEHYLNGLTVTSIEMDHEEGMWFSTSSQGFLFTNHDGSQF